MRKNNKIMKISARCTIEEKECILKNAQKYHMNESEYVLRSCLSDEPVDFYKKLTPIILSLRSVITKLDIEDKLKRKDITNIRKKIKEEVDALCRL